MAEKPTIVLVGGSCQTTEFYEPLKERLQAHGFPVIVPTLPTCSNINRAELGKTKVTDDVAAIQSVLDTLILQQSKTVVVVMHSYGSLPTSATKVQDLTVESRNTAGYKGGLVKFVFFGGMAMPEGATFVTLNGGTIPEFDQLHDDGTYSFLIAADILLHDLSNDEREKWAAKIIPQSQDVFHFASHDTAFKYAPVAVVVLNQDKGVPPQYQEMTAQTYNGKTIKIDAGHGAHLSHTDLLAKSVGDAIDDAST